MARCWRQQKHQHGDRTPSVGLDRRANRAKCFVCDPKRLSPIDLVMSVREVNRGDAVRWLVAHFEIPNLPKGKHVESKERWPERFRIGTSGSALDILIRCGVWASLTPAQRSILPVLDAFSDADRTLEISYRGLMRYAGVRSQSTISRALKRFQNLRVLSIVKARDEDGFRSCNRYRLTLDDPLFRETARRTQETQAEELALERELRARAKAERKALITGKYSVQPVESGSI
jgi:DNA-binding transcriptional ArsR family regulator